MILEQLALLKYHEFDFKVITRTEGDIFADTNVE